MTKETVQITEDIKEAEESGIEIEYYTLDGKKPVLHMAPGDLMIICNVLHDYAQEPLVKDNDIGEDALVLAMRQRNRKKNEEKQRKEFEDTGLRPGELFALERSDINLTSVILM